MTFADIPTGEMVFLDANVFIHYFGRDPDLGPPARDLLRRIESGELRGFTTTHILAEVLHRLMTIEAMQSLGWPYAGIAQRLRQHPDAIEKLHVFRIAFAKSTIRRWQFTKSPWRTSPTQRESVSRKVC